MESPDKIYQTRHCAFPQTQCSLESIPYQSPQAVLGRLSVVPAGWVYLLLTLVRFSEESLEEEGVDPDKESQRRVFDKSPKVP